MLSEFQSVGVEWLCAVLSASLVVAQCVAQEASAAVTKSIVATSSRRRGR